MSELEKGRAAPVSAAPKGAPITEKTHTLTVTAREDVQITGVTEVVSFDENLVLLKTTAGDLVLEGTGLRVRVLDVAGGCLAVTGTLCGLYYSDQRGEGRRTRRSLFRS